MKTNILKTIITLSIFSIFWSPSYPMGMSVNIEQFYEQDHSDIDSAQQDFPSLVISDQEVLGDLLEYNTETAETQRLLFQNSVANIELADAIEPEALQEFGIEQNQESFDDLLIFQDTINESAMQSENANEMAEIQHHTHIQSKVKTRSELSSNQFKESDALSTKFLSGVVQGVARSLIPRGQTSQPSPAQSVANVMHSFIRDAHLSDQSINDLCHAGLTLGEIYEFATKGFENLPMALQEKIASSPQILANNQLSRQVIEAPRPIYTNPVDENKYFNVVQEVVRIGDVYSQRTDVTLTSLGTKVVEQTAQHTTMLPHIQSPFVHKAKWSWFQQDVLLEVSPKEIFALRLSPETQRACAEIIRGLELNPGCPSVAGLVTYPEALQARLELLQVSALYQHPEFRSLVKSFPEYEAFVCTIAQRLQTGDDSLQLHKIVVDGDDTLAQYIIKEANRLVHQKSDILAQQYCEHLTTVCKQLAAASEVYLERLAHLNPNEGVVAAQKQLEQINAIALSGENSLSLNGLSAANALISQLENVPGGPIKIQDIISVAKDGKQLYFPKVEWGSRPQIAHPVQALKGLERYQKQLQKHPAQLVENVFEPLNKIIVTDLETQYLIDQYSIEAPLLTKQYDNPAQREVFNGVKEKLNALAPQLTSEEKILARGVAKGVLALNEMGKVQEANNFLDLLSVDSFKQICEGVLQALGGQLGSVDIYTVSEYFTNAITHNALSIGLNAISPNVYLTYCFTRNIIGVYQHSNNLIDDAFKLAEALQKNDMRAFGNALVQTCEDFYYAYQSSKSLKDASTGLLHAARGSNRGGGSPEERYKKPTVQIKNEFFELEFGKKIKNKCIKLKGSSVYKMTEKHNKHLKKGYIFYLDTAHGDHIEVFDNNGTFKCVLNLDGSYNVDKSDAAESRTFRR